MCDERPTSPMRSSLPDHEPVAWRAGSTIIDWIASIRRWLSSAGDGEVSRPLCRVGSSVGEVTSSSDGERAMRTSLRADATIEEFSGSASGEPQPEWAIASGGSFRSLSSRSAKAAEWAAAEVAGPDEDRED
jgi:hypothetical protein